jgi:hypothetical protein
MQILTLLVLAAKLYTCSCNLADDTRDQAVACLQDKALGFTGYDGYEEDCEKDGGLGRKAAIFGGIVLGLCCVFCTAWSYMSRLFFKGPQMLVKYACELVCEILKLLLKSVVYICTCCCRDRGYEPIQPDVGFKTNNPTLGEFIV